MSVEQNIAFGLKLRRVPDEQVAAAQFSVYAFNGANIAPASTAVVSRGVAYGKAKYRRSLRASRQ
jgi:ABC-type Fe3+/spermidine/putrescine transport system ATPase subunit